MVVCRLHERKLLRLQQEEEAELVAQRERELELQVAPASLTLQPSARCGRMWSSSHQSQAAPLARSLLNCFCLPFKHQCSHVWLKRSIPITMLHDAAVKMQGDADAGDRQEEAVSAAAH